YAVAFRALGRLKQLEQVPTHDLLGLRIGGIDLHVCTGPEAPDIARLTLEQVRKADSDGMIQRPANSRAKLVRRVEMGVVVAEVFRQTERLTARGGDPEPDGSLRLAAGG